MKCWVCGTRGMSFLRAGETEFKPEDLLITDSRYGLTAPLYKCRNCGFMQCETAGLTELYKQLADAEYINTAPQRRKQFEFLLKHSLPLLGETGEGTDILDVGAGAGLFVKLASERGFKARGIEPSAYLANLAVSQNLPVINAASPDYPENSFNAIYMTDVLEHIADPFPLLLKYRETLKGAGLLFLTVPDVSSLAARLMGKRWWHFRMAHVGYYSKKTLNVLMRRAGFKLIKYLPVRWYFQGGYAFERLCRYIPPLSGIKRLKFLNGLFIPVSFGDSFVAVYAKKSGEGHK